MADRRYVLVPEDSIVTRWVCEVVRHGYHNGPGCTPSYPHDGSWDCHMRAELSLPAPMLNHLARLTIKTKETSNGND